MTKKIPSVVGILIVLFLSAAVGTFSWLGEKSVDAMAKASYSMGYKFRLEKRTACPMLAKLCPDGSSVVPTGPNCQFPACPEVSNAQQTGQTQTNTKTIYTNTDFGFQMTIPKGYEDYKALIEKDPGSTGITYIHFIFKTSDPQYKNFVTENPVTHEKYPGYADIFALGVWEMNAYNKIVQDCKSNPMPDCPYNIIGQNNKYVVDFSVGNGMAPKDMNSLWDMLQKSKDIGKTLEFKFL